MSIISVFFPEVRKISGNKMYTPVGISLGPSSLFFLSDGREKTKYTVYREKFTTSAALMDTKMVVFKTYDINITSFEDLF